MMIENTEKKMDFVNYVIETFSLSSIFTACQEKKIYNQTLSGVN